MFRSCNLVAVPVLGVCIIALILCSGPFAAFPYWGKGRPFLKLPIAQQSGRYEVFSLLEMSLTENGRWSVTGEGAIEDEAIEARITYFVASSRGSQALRLRLPAAMPCKKFVELAKCAERSGVHLILLATARRM